jgi:hypothetical protein
MHDKATWLEKYGLIPKIILVLLFFIWIGGLNLILDFNERTPTYQERLDEWVGPSKYSGPEYENWKKRRDASVAEAKQIVSRAEKDPDVYSLYQYFQDADKLMDIEDNYKINLTTGACNYLDRLNGILHQKAVWKAPKYKYSASTSVEEQYIEKIQQRFNVRHGLVQKNTSLVWQKVLWTILVWVLLNYLRLTFFWLLIYLIRFGQKPREVSLKEELLLCPERFLLRVLSWPFFCWKYPVYETTAEMVRYNRLKAEYLRYQPIGYQLSDREEDILRAKAKAPVKDFDKTIKGIKEFKITPLVIRKSLATAYLSLFLGVMFQPAIILAAQHSVKINDHFYGQIQINEIGHESQFLDNHGADPPNNNGSFWAISSAKFETKDPLLVWWLVNSYILVKPQEVIKEIFHIPLARLFLGAAKAYKPLTV